MKKQRGFSLWELAVLLGVLGVAIVAGFALLRSQQASQLESLRTAQLTSANKALEGFVAEYARLPCPDTSGDGTEDCSGAAQKGWLPYKTLHLDEEPLGLDAVAPERGIVRLRYIVYRGSGADLTAYPVPDRYNPVKYDLTSTYSYGQLNTLDFCTGLNQAGSAGANASSAYIPGASGGPVNVAYALAEGGIDKDGDGNAFDGLNVSVAAPVLESPAKPADINYDDIVQSRSFADLKTAFQCPLTPHSVDAISMAVETANTVLDLTQANHDNGVQQTINAAIATAMDAVAIGIGIAGIVDGGVVLSAAIAEAAASLGLDFAADAAIGIAIAGLAIEVAGMVAYGISVGLDIAALVKSAEATGKAGASPPSGMPAGSTCDSQCQLANIQGEIDQLSLTNPLDPNYKYSVAYAQANCNSATSAQNNALTAYNNNVNALFTTAHGYDSQHNNDALLNTALSDYKIYTTDTLAYYSAQNDLSNVQKKKDGVDQAIPQAQTKLNTDQAALNANPSDATLQATVQSDQSTLTSLQNQQSLLAGQVTTAQTAVNQANQTMNTAYSNASTAWSNAINAYPANGQQSIATALNTATSAWFSNAIDPFLFLYTYPYGYPYQDGISNPNAESYISDQAKATSVCADATGKQNTLASLQQSYTALSNAIQNGTATSGLGQYTNAESILQQADRKGALQ